MRSLSERRPVREGSMRVPRSARHASLLAAAAAALAACAAGTAHGGGRNSAATGALELRAQLRLVSIGVEPPPEVPPDVSGCRARTGTGLVSGLGSVSETYTWCYRIGPPTCPSDLAKPLETTGRLVVLGKGEIRFTLAEGARCVELEAVRDESQDFRIAGGTGAYEGATGSGTVEPSLGGGLGREMWNGTVVVPGLEFDVIAPTLSGAVAKTVRAPRGSKHLRVTHSVSARDDVDGAVPVSCSPRSGTRFRIGRTVVTCSASDTSGNTRTARFTITVRPRR